ncbi:MAG TPA: acylphosphatase [Methylophilaceae bacterium]|nr:acylphosphatase [Methylophilaceae bacterium]
MVARQLRIHGRVQGVGFRQSLQASATAAGLEGWVRNRRDGTVEAVLSGDDARVQAVVDWTYQGPGLARVVHVDVCECEPPEAAGFAILPTA